MDEREELAEEWILFFLCLHVCILKHLDLFFAVLYLTKEKVRLLPPTTTLRRRRREKKKKREEEEEERRRREKKKKRA